MVFFRLLEVEGFPFFFARSCQQVVKHMVVSKSKKNQKQAYQECMTRKAQSIFVREPLGHGLPQPRLLFTQSRSYGCQRAALVRRTGGFTSSTVLNEPKVMVRYESMDESCAHVQMIPLGLLWCPFTSFPLSKICSLD